MHSIERSQAMSSWSDPRYSILSILWRNYEFEAAEASEVVEAAKVIEVEWVAKIYFFHCNYLNIKHFEFFEVKETILINEAGEVTMALEANEVIRSFKIGCDTSIQYFNDKQ